MEDHRVHIREIFLPVQLLQQIHINGKANGPALAAHFPWQLVILSAGQDAGGNTFQVPPEHHAAVVAQVVAHREIQPHILRKSVFLQQFQQVFQLFQRLLFLRTRQPWGQRFQCFLPAPTGGHCLQSLPGSLFSVAQGLQVVGIFPLQAGHGLFALPVIKPKPVQHRRQQAHVGNIQHIVLPQQRKALHRQQRRLGNVVGRQIAHTFQSRLHDLPVVPVDVLTIVDLLHHAGGLRGIFHNGQRHVRLQCHQLAALPGEGDDLVGNQKILVPYVKVVFLKLAHFIGGVAVALVQSPQGEYRLLLTSPNLIRHHRVSPLSSDCPGPPGSRCRSSGTGSPG